MATDAYIKFLRMYIEELRNQRDEAMERNAALVNDKTNLRVELMQTRRLLASEMAANGKPNAHLYEYA